MSMGNLVWKRFVTLRLPIWVEWFLNNPVKSHFQVIHRFILSNPYYVPPLHSTEEDVEVQNIFSQLMIDTEFIDSLSDKGAQVWYNSNFSDFIEELKPYMKRYEELKLLISLYNKFPWWFERVYAHLRREMAKYLENKGRTFK